MSPLAGILLAAGGSARLGRDKRLLHFRGETLLRRAAAALAAVADPAVVVLPDPRAELTRELDGLAVEAVHAAETAEGMGRSLALGAAALGARRVAEGSVLVTLVDQPRVDAGLLAALAAAAEGGEGWAVCDYGDGNWGPPVCLPAAALPDLETLRGDRGARAIVERHERRSGRVVRHPAPGARRDIDSDEDYARLASEADA
ncbi:MAG: NTP transferase domain-containing protein [Holophagales bacterium]|nr:NTP transferase domain-containing protein [Holophagales bacterium]